MTHLFMRLARDKEIMIMVLTGHGERSISGGTNYDLGEFGKQSLNKGFMSRDYMAVFLFARQVTIDENKKWYGISLVEVAQQGWVETGGLDDDVNFNRIYDVAGPVSIAAVLSRSLRDSEQRVLVTGSGHFLANTNARNGGNLDFGLNLINWLADNDQFILLLFSPMQSVTAALFSVERG